MTTTLRYDDNRGDLAYPFLPAEWRWQIASHPLGADSLESLNSDPTPTLRWVKDDKVLDLHVPGMNTAAFLAATGLRLSMQRGGYVLSKRLARLLRPYRYYAFFAADAISIDHDPALDARLWDGCGRVSRAFIRRLADRLDLSDRQRRELLHGRRFEVTLLHAGGEEKGHVIVDDDLTADFLFPAGSAKPAVALDNGQVFVGLQPVHGADGICLDIQSLINLHPFFQPEQLLAWAHTEGSLFLDGIRSGRLAGVLDRLHAAGSASDLDALQRWHVGEYIASGGNLMWFAGMVKAVGRQHLKRLGSRAERLRCPAPGMRYYIAPAAVGRRDVPRGHITIDPACATAWVNDQDWCEFIVDVLGGCDGDDALWLFPFRDLDERDAQGQPTAKVLAWRSPNQLGEYVLLRPTADSHTLVWQTAHGPAPCPHMHSRLLPPRIDSVTYQYGSLAEASDHENLETAYSVATLTSTIARAAANRGVLGSYCNVTMLCKALYGRLPQRLPATLEDVIDGSVKTGRDLTPVREWNELALSRMVAHGRRNPARRLPQALLGRLPAWLQAQACPADGHWLETLVQALADYRAQYTADLDALATEAGPPLDLFLHGERHLHLGQELGQIYGRTLRLQMVDSDSDNDCDSDSDCDDVDIHGPARAACEAYLAQWPAAVWPRIVLGAAVHLYAQGPQDGAPVRDGVLWQLGAPAETADGGRAPGIAQLMLAALREVGLLGQPLWTDAGPVRYYDDAPCPRQTCLPVKLVGTWFNWLNATGERPYRRMGDVPPDARAAAKAQIAAFSQTCFRDMTLSTHVSDNNRVTTRTPHGNLFAYVARGHELAVLRRDRWRVAWATAVDGNLLALLAPVAA